jgi:hypothetical protein
MLHLNAERLAELADSEPTAVESAHLSVCEACCRERAAHQRLLVYAAADRDRLAPPLTDWESLAARMRDEGVLAPGTSTRQGQPGRGRALVWWMRIAAGLLVATGGAVVGRMSAESSLRNAVIVDALVADTSVSINPDSLLASAGYIENVANTTGVRPIGSVEEASALLRRAQLDYQRAAAFLAQQDTLLEAPNVYRARLAALDELAGSLESAMVQARQDPVINAYYRATMQTRNVTLQQLGSAVQLVSY